MELDILYSVFFSCPIFVCFLETDRSSVCPGRGNRSPGPRNCQRGPDNWRRGRDKTQSDVMVGGDFEDNYIDGGN